MEKIAMISQPMNGLTREEIFATKEEAKKLLEGKGYKIVNTYFEDFDESQYKNKRMAYLAKSIEELSKVDLLYCCKGWDNARGCKFEHDIALAYGVEVIEEN